MFRIIGIEPSPRKATREQSLTNLADFLQRQSAAEFAISYRLQYRRKPSPLMIRAVGPSTASAATCSNEGLHVSPSRRLSAHLALPK